MPSKARRNNVTGIHWMIRYGHNDGDLHLVDNDKSPKRTACNIADKNFRWVKPVSIVRPVRQSNWNKCLICVAKESEFTNGQG